MKKKVLIGLAIASLMLPSNVQARSAVVNFTGEDNVTVGDTIKVVMNVADVLDTTTGVVSLSGRLTFDEDILEYVSAKNLNTPYKFYINPDYYYTIAGLDFTLENGIHDNTDIYEFTFKAKNTGTTSVTLNESTLTDTKDYLDSTVNKLDINVLPKKEVVAPITKESSVKIEKEETPIKVQNQEKSNKEEEPKENKKLEITKKEEKPVSKPVIKEVKEVIDTKPTKDIAQVSSATVKQKLKKANNYVHTFVKKITKLF